MALRSPLGGLTYFKLLHMNTTTKIGHAAGHPRIIRTKKDGTRLKKTRLLSELPIAEQSDSRFK